MKFQVIRIVDFNAKNHYNPTMVPFWSHNEVNHMATLTIKNLPDEVYALLTRKAKRNRRSLNNEAMVRLEKSLNSEDRDVETTLERIRKNREELSRKGIWLTDEFLEFAKNEGRP